MLNSDFLQEKMPARYIIPVKLWSTVPFCCVLLLSSLNFSSPAFAVNNPLSAITGKKPEAQPVPTVSTELTDEEIDANRLKLESRSAELRQQYAPETVAALRKTYRNAASVEELESWEKLNGKLAGILEDHATSLYRLKSYRKTTRSRLEEMKGWKGFAEKPPYPISLLDSLSEALHSKQSVIKSLDVIRATIESEFEEHSENLKNSSKQMRLAEEGLEKSMGGPDEQRSRWLLQLAQLQHAVNQAGTVYGETRRISMSELHKGAQAEVDFLSQKLTVARGNYRFTEDELQQKLQSIDAMLLKIHQMLELEKGKENNIRTKLDAAEAATAAAKTGAVPKGALDRLLKEQKRWQIRFDDATIRVLVTNGMYQLLKNEKTVWQERFLLAKSGADQKKPDIKDESRKRRNELDFLAKWKEYVTTKITVCATQIKSLQEGLASAALSDADREDARLFLSIFREQEAVLQRGILFLDNYEQLLQRRNEEAKKGEKSIERQVSGTFSRIASLAKSIWNSELYVAEETIIVDNQKISRPRSVTISKVVEAVLILFVGTWLIRFFKKPLLWFITHRFRLGPNDAHLYTRLLTYLMFIAVLVSALIFVNIPLAVFTFFGGALAIGVGFGAQALIGNFISGLILMFDRTIRMGDVVEVDGHRGRVATIGMRSSSIKRFDGVEMLVPNSLFLQQNVINWTSSDPQARYSISIGVAYGSPTREVDRIIRMAVEEQSEVLRDPAPYVVFENFGDSSLNFTAYFWIELDPNVNSLVVFSDIRHRISEQLAAAGIPIPFPQRDLHLDIAKPLEIKVLASRES